MTRYNKECLHEAIVTKMLHSQVRYENYSLAMRLGVFKNREERQRALLVQSLAAEKDCEEIINMGVKKHGH